MQPNPGKATMAETEETEYDLAVIGSGGAAFAAAIRASGLGKRVAMVERGTIGGTCVNTGCVPSKALLAAAEARHVALDAGRFAGLGAADVPVDMAALVAGKQDLVDGMRSGKYLDLIAGYGWDLHQGDASFTGSADQPELDIAFPDAQPKRIRAAHYVVATGSSPWASAVEGLEETGYLTSTTALGTDRGPGVPPGDRRRIRGPRTGTAVRPARLQGDRAGPLTPGLRRGARSGTSPDGGFRGRGHPGGPACGAGKSNARRRRCGERHGHRCRGHQGVQRHPSARGRRPAPCYGRSAPAGCRRRAWRER